MSRNQIALCILVAFALSIGGLAYANASGSYSDYKREKVVEKPEVEPEPEKPVIERGPGSGTSRSDRDRTTPNYCRCYEPRIAARKPASCLWTNDTNKLEARRGGCLSRRWHD